MSIEQKTLTLVDCEVLHSAINDNVNISPSCLGVTHHEPNRLLIEFDADLSGAEQTELDTEIENHTP